MARNRSRAASVNAEPEEELSPQEQERKERAEKSVSVVIAQDETIIDGQMYSEGDEIELTFGDIARYRRGGLCFTLSKEDELELAKNNKLASEHRRTGGPTNIARD